MLPAFSVTEIIGEDRLSDGVTDAEPVFIVPDPMGGGTPSVNIVVTVAVYVMFSRSVYGTVLFVTVDPLRIEGSVNAVPLIKSLGRNEIGVVKPGILLLVITILEIYEKSIMNWVSSREYCSPDVFLNVSDGAGVFAIAPAGEFGISK
jgi:hypothetical protein